MISDALANPISGSGTSAIKRHGRETRTNGLSDMFTVPGGTNGGQEQLASGEGAVKHLLGQVSNKQAI